MRETTQTPECWVRLDGEDHDGTIEAFELFSARRALALVRHELGRERLLELLHEEMRPWDASAGTPPTASAPGGGPANARSSHIVLADGTVVGSVSTALHDEADGLTARLSVALPSTSGALVQQHLEHFAVEFRNWILRAAEEQWREPD